MPRENEGIAGRARFVDFEPRAPHAPNGHDAARPTESLVEILPATAFNPEPIRWLWPGWLARGKLHLLAGAPGTGKTTIGVSTAAMVSSGGRWPDGSEIATGSVLIWSGEDDIGDTLLPRLMVAGGVRERVHFIRGTTERGKARPFDPATDMPGLAAAAAKIPDVRLLIVDPVVLAVVGDSHKNVETRRGLQPIVDLAAQIGVAVLGITHLTKNTSGRDPLERVTGSLAFGAVARVVLTTVKPADAEAPRRMVRVKSNIGPDSGGFEYTLLGAPVPGYDTFSAQRVEWGEPLEGTARELMAVEQDDNDADALEEAEAFLHDQLASGAVPTKELQQAAKAHGHQWRTIERAEKDLGVVATKEGFQGAWAWCLPDPKAANIYAKGRQHD